MKRQLHQFLLLAMMTVLCAPAWGQDTTPNANDALALRQSQLADKYDKLESLLLRMAEIESSENPRRAALLKQALGQSKEKLTLAQLRSLTRWLNQESSPTKRVVDGQKNVVTDMEALLNLLLTENRPDRNLDDQRRIRQYIKDVERLIRLQSSNIGRNKGGEDADKLAKDQGKVADRTKDLADRIRENEEGGNSDGDSKGDSEGDSKGDSEGDSKGDSEGDSKGDSEGDSKGDSEGDSKGDSEGDSKGDSEGDSKGDSEGDSKGDSEGDSKGDSEGDSKGDSEGDSKGDSEGDSKGDSEGDSKGDSEGDSKGDSEGDSKGDSEGDSKGDSEGDSKGDSQGNSKGDQQAENPVRKRIQAAEERMREAQRRLEEAKRGDALEEQEKAREDLEKAKAELEEILRQLREEEIERMLAMLEGRFRKMLETQIRIYESTVAMNRIPLAERDRQVDIRAGKLAFEERKLVLDADRAYQLLVEEGSSIAFPETVDLMREDMEQVSSRLAQTKIGTITQGVEEDIIRALEEMIEALQKAQQEMEEQKPQDGEPPPPGQPQDQPLVDQIAELKMIRALQLRVNTRTQRYSRLLDNEDDPVGQAEDTELKSAITRLGDRQERVQRITRDIVLGKNK
jgi:hypothetical protein